MGPNNKDNLTDIVQNPPEADNSSNQPLEDNQVFGDNGEIIDLNLTNYFKR